MKLIVANWKMYLDTNESIKMAECFLRTLPEPQTKVVLCPSFTSLAGVSLVIKNSFYGLGAQDVGWEERGAFTGEISPRDLRKIGCEYIIIGHSERRHILGETDAVVHNKLKISLKMKFKPILCVGETLKERKLGQTAEAVKRQLLIALNGLNPEKNGQLVIAYEPVWAIDTDVAVSPEDVVCVHSLIKKLTNKLASKKDKVKIIYGGSVETKNVVSFLKNKEVEGVLVGGASVKRSFIDLLKASANL